MNSYERLDAWEAAHRFVLLVYRTTRGFPSEERFGLSSQLRDIAVGSVAEIRYTLRLVKDLELITAEQFNDLESDRDKVGRLTWGLYTSMRRAIARTG